VNEPEELVCPITRCLLRDPVVNAAGHTYERAALACALSAGVRAGNEHPRDPLTNAELLTPLVFTNWTVRRLVAAFLAAHPQHTPDGWPDRTVAAHAPVGAPPPELSNDSDDSSHSDDSDDSDSDSDSEHALLHQLLGQSPGQFLSEAGGIDHLFMSDMREAIRRARRRGWAGAAMFGSEFESDEEEEHDDYGEEEEEEEEESEQDLPGEVLQQPRFASGELSNYLAHILAPGVHMGTSSDEEGVFGGTSDEDEEGEGPPSPPRRRGAARRGAHGRQVAAALHHVAAVAGLHPAPAAQPPPADSEEEREERARPRQRRRRR